MKFKINKKRDTRAPAQPTGDKQQHKNDQHLVKKVYHSAPKSIPQQQPASVICEACRASFGDENALRQHITYTSKPKHDSVKARIGVARKDNKNQPTKLPSFNKQQKQQTNYASVTVALPSYHKPQKQQKQQTNYPPFNYTETNTRNRQGYYIDDFEHAYVAYRTSDWQNYIYD